MNELIVQVKGHVYLAKDLFLTAEQYQQMYNQHGQFSKLLTSYQSSMTSDMAKRLGITQ